MDKERSINNFSIVAFIFSFIMAPVGLILSIIGLVRCKNYEKEYEEKPKYYIFDILGLVVSIFKFVITLFVIVIIVFSVNFTISQEKKIYGNYTCTYPNSPIPAVSAEFKDGSFKWGKYGSVNNNFVSGTFRVKSVQINNGEYNYKLKLTPNTVNSTTSRIRTKEYYDVEMKINGNDVKIIFDNSTTYNCYLEENSNEF